MKTMLLILTLVMSFGAIAHGDDMHVDIPTVDAKAFMAALANTQIFSSSNINTIGEPQLLQNARRANGR